MQRFPTKTRHASRKGFSKRYNHILQGTAESPTSGDSGDDGEGLVNRLCFEGNKIIVVKFLSNEFMKRCAAKSRFNNRGLRFFSSFAVTNFRSRVPSLSLRNGERSKMAEGRLEVRGLMADGQDRVEAFPRNRRNSFFLGVSLLTLGPFLLDPLKGDIVAYPFPASVLLGPYGVISDLQRFVCAMESNAEYRRRIQMSADVTS